MREASTEEAQLGAASPSHTVCLVQNKGTISPSNAVMAPQMFSDGHLSHHRDFSS